jgi:hypothetical protein
MAAPRAGASRRLASATLQPKIVGMEPPIRAYAGNMQALSSVPLKCSKCGGKEIERTLVYTEVELRGFLRAGEQGRDSMVMTWWKPPMRPDLHPDVLRELELQGVDAVRYLAPLITGRYGDSPTNRDTPMPLGNISIKRGDMQDWLKWRAEVDAYWPPACWAAA